MKQIITTFLLSSALFAAEENIDINPITPVKEADSEEVAFLDKEELQIPIPQEPSIQETPSLQAPATKSVFLTTFLSSLFPGLGHLYLGELPVAGGLAGSYSAGITAANIYQSNESFFISSAVTVQSIWSYGIYAAYRDARSFNNNKGYSYQMPKDTLLDMTLAPFSLSIISKPEVLGGFVGAFALAAAIAHFAFPETAYIHLSPSMEFPALALPIGIGEESFFRGYLQPMLSEYLTPTGGIILSSLIFGAMHIPNALLLEPQDRWRYFSFSLPFITAMGGYFGWLTHKNHSLKESVALHTWYDFTLFAIGALATKAAIGQTNFAISIPF